MHETINFLSQEVPAWYELSAKDGGIILRIDQSAVGPLIDRDWEKAPIVGSIRKEFNLSEFISPDQGNWGFGGVLKPLEDSSNGWKSWEFKLPRFKTTLPNQETPQLYSFELRGTLCVLFMALQLRHETTKQIHSQLIIIEGLAVGRDLNDGALSATLTPAMSFYLSNQKEGGELQQLRQAMMDADQYMWQEDNPSSFRKHDFRIYFNPPKSLHLQVPGDACGLDPEHMYNPSIDYGFRLCPHNVDNSCQQLTLLYALAKLHDLARAE